MFRFFCDGCGREMTADETRAKHRFGEQGIRGSLVLDCRVLLNNVYDAAQVCRECVQRIVAKGSGS